MSKFGDKVKSIFAVDYDDYEDDYYDDYYDDEVVEEKPKKPAREKYSSSNETSTPARQSSRQTTSNRFSRSSNRKVVSMKGGDMEVCVIKPQYYENAREVIDVILEGKAAVVNLEGIKLDLAQRIIDVIIGGCYAINGNLQKISGYIYLVTPASVDISGDVQDFLADSGVEFGGGAPSFRNF